MRTFTREEVSRRNRRRDAAIVIDNEVYDVTEFLDHHPGGVEVLLDNAGGDASRCFADVGHSDEAKLLRARYKVGEVVETERREAISSPLTEHSADHPAHHSVDSSVDRSADHAADLSDGHTLRGLLDVMMPPLLLAAVSLLAYQYLFP